MSRKKQTAVDLLRDRLFKEFGFGYSDNIHDELKAMEKEQIREAYYTSLSSQYWNKGEQWLNDESEIYYNSTYGQ
jgi:hypothetical protein